MSADASQTRHRVAGGRIVASRPLLPLQRVRSALLGTLLTIVVSLGWALLTSVAVVAIRPPGVVAFIVGVCPTVGFAVLGVVLTVLACRRRQVFVADSGGVRTGLLGRRMRPTSLVVRARPGFLVEIRADERPWFSIELAPDPPGDALHWPSAAVDHLIHDLQEVLGYTVRDERPHAALRAWCEDPLYRSWCAVDRLLHDNARQFGRLTSIPATAPSTEVTPFGVTVEVPLRPHGALLQRPTAITIDAHQLRVGDRAWPVKDVLRVYRYFARVGRHDVAILAVLTPTGEHVLGRTVLHGLTDATTAVINGAPEAIHAALPLPQEGSTADVPDAIRALLQGQASDRSQQ
jgi:hypothetical protein